jgi:CRP-like cAMP-binding protein
VAGAGGTRRPFRRGIVQFEGKALKIGANRLKQLVEESAGIRDMAMRNAEIVVFTMLQTAACNALHPLESRLGRWLLMARDRIRKPELRVTHEYLAEALGVHRPAVTLALKSLRRYGLASGRGYVRIDDAASLEQATCECYRTIRYQLDEMLAGG